MTDDPVKQALAELQDVVRCRCHPAYTGRGLHDPDCECDSAEALKVVSDRIEELEAKLAGGSFYQEKDIDALQDRLAAQAAEIERLKTKLKKAVELALEECPFQWGTGVHNDWWHHRRTMLAELTGAKP